MPIKSAEEYWEEARRVRALAMKLTSPTAQMALLDTATTYDDLARHAETLGALNKVSGA